MRNFFLHISFLALLSIAGVGELYAQIYTSSNDQVINQASLTYTEEGSGLEIIQYTNEVTVTIESNPEFDFFPNNSIVDFRGTQVEITHFLTNTGNTTATYSIKGYNQQEGDDYDLQDLSWNTQQVTQAKVNTLFNTDTLTTQITLEPNQQFEVSYFGTISITEPKDSLNAQMVFEATDLATGITKINIDDIKIRIGAVVELKKSQSGNADKERGDEFTYTITGENTGDMTAFPLDITVDGLTQQSVILTDSIPANLMFTRFESLSKGRPLYHLAETGKLEFQTTPPENLDDVDKIGVAFDSLQVGETFEVTFGVLISENASGQIVNIADITFVDPDGTVVVEGASNDVVANIDGATAEIDYFTNEDFEEKTATSSIGDPLNIQATASACNENRARVERVRIAIISELTGDEEEFEGIETGRNTGVFRIPDPVPTRDGNEFEVVQFNSILETTEEDVVTAVLNCAGLGGGIGGPATIEAAVIVDPFGFVFDSETNEVVQGAEIRIIDVTGQNNGGNPGELATVYRPNGRDITNNIENSDVQGKYRFPFLRPGTYRLEVIPPQGYKFASELFLNQLPEGRKVDSLASYGMDFTIVGDPIGLDVDIPLDPLATGVLFAEKTVDRKVADIGDYLNYKIEVNSKAINTINDMRVNDVLPFGFKYVLGTTRVDGDTLADPSGGQGPNLEFNIGSIDPGDKKTLTYRVYIGPGAERGDGINKAQVLGDSLIIKISNEAKVNVEVRGGVFSEEALIVGKVFLDCDENNMQDASELGIPGVRLYLENGNYVITDSEGKYSFYAVKANKHVLKIDNHSLPTGSKLKVLDNRHAFDPSSRFVDVKKGELHRADFAVCECTEQVYNEITKRANALTSTDDALATSLSKSFTVNESNSNRGSGRFDQASGTIGNAKAPKIGENKSSNKPENIQSTPGELVPSDSVAETPQVNIEQLLIGADSGTEILNVQDQDTLALDKLTILAKGAKGGVFDLYVNGEIVPASRIGQRSSSSENELQVWEYVSIQLQPGVNTILLHEGDPFGNLRGSDTKQVYVPGELADVQLNVIRNYVAADGNSTALIEASFVDKDGIKIGSRLPITLDTEQGTWLVRDINSELPGTQTFVEGGTALFELKAPIKPYTSLTRISVGDKFAETTIEFLPDLRPLIAAGIIEGSLRLREPLNIANTENDGFERELKELSYSMNNFTADARFAFFLKGKVSGKTLLTAGFDSEKEKEERLFRDMRPEEYYPIYGEAAIRGYDAQSSGRLYIRLDRGKTYVLYGDFITQQNDADIQLGAYNRAQNGVKSHFEQGALQVDAFGVSSVSARRIKEFRGQGISRYELPDNDLIENSEIIEIITYDREQIATLDSTGVPSDPSMIISRERLTRFTDYVVDPFTGVITFKAPISSVDSDFNPVYIRATYEVENDEERYLIGGVGAKIAVADGVNVGAGLVQDNNPNNEFTMATGNLNIELGENTQIIGEVAHTITDENGNGTAGRVELRHRGKKFDMLTQVGKSSSNFDNEGASLGQARTEARSRARVSLTKSTKVGAEFLLSRNDTTGDQTVGGLLSLQQNVATGVNAEVGIRYSDKTSKTAEAVTNTNLRGKVTAELPFIKGASTFGEYEQDINASDRKLIAIGGDYKIKSFAKAFARHEFVSSTGGQYTLQSNAQRNSTVFGLSANYLKNGQIFSEYRMNDAVEGRSGQASLGLRNRFVIKEGLGMNVGFERIFTVQGPNRNDGTSISTAIDYTGSDKWKGTARAEARFGQNQDTYLNSLGYGVRLSEDWTMLARNIISINSIKNAAGVQKIQERLQFGAAYRDTHTNMFDALIRYEFKYEKDDNIAPDFSRTAHVFSTHANYKPQSDLVISGRVAAKYTKSEDDLNSDTSFLELVSGRALYDINDRWDAGINASLLANSDFSTKNYGLGVELGYIVATNLRLAGGFNFFGYEDEDLATNNYTQPGAYLGFAYKFDEQIFRNLAPNRAMDLLDESVYLKCVPCEIPKIKTMPVDMLAHELEPVILTRELFEFEPLATLVILPRQIHFDNDMSYINASAAQMLDKLAKYLINKDEYLIDLNGFTDTKASIAYNAALSERRSLAVRAYLVAAGVDKRRLLIEGFGELDATGKNAVEMALERRVEFDLNELNEDVTFVDQVEDLQVQQKAKNVGPWDYIFKFEHNAVPTNINLQAGSDELNFLNRYMIERIAIAMDKYPEIGVRIALPADDRFVNLQMEILAELERTGADINRYMFARGVQGDQNTIQISYTNDSLLELFEQKDDIKFLNNSQINELIESLLRILKSRVDYELIQDLSQSYVVPDRVNFVVNSTKLDNESQAVMSRIGSYLRNNPGVYLELRGDGSQRDRNRMIEMQRYLQQWGVDGGRVEFSQVTVQTDGTAIRVEYKNADSINLLNVKSLNLKPGAGTAGR
ncbi:MAG: OmpA family protein [Balneolaceae bacterium]|nr:OmpA family protein [Balneolaceae bacterium]